MNFIFSGYHLQLPYLCAESVRLEPQLSAEWSHLHHQSMSLFSKALFWCKRRSICLWDGPFVWKMPLHAKTDTASCLLCHSKRQFLCLRLFLFVPLSLLSVRVLTLHHEGQHYCSVSFYIFTTFFSYFLLNNSYGGILKFYLTFFYLCLANHQRTPGKWIRTSLTL